MNLAQTIVNTGKLECHYINAAGGHGTGLIILNGEVSTSRQPIALVNHTK